MATGEAPIIFWARTPRGTRSRRAADGVGGAADATLPDAAGANRPNRVQANVDGTLVTFDNIQRDTPFPFDFEASTADGTRTLAIMLGGLSFIILDLPYVCDGGSVG